MLSAVLFFLLTSLRAQNAWANIELQWDTSDSLSMLISLFPSWKLALKSQVAVKIGSSSENSNSSEKYEICLTPGCHKAAYEVLVNMNKDADPCDNFYEFACGNFTRRTKIPDDKAKVNQISITKDMVAHQIKVIVEEPSTNDEAITSRMAKNFYKTCMDKAKIEEIGLSHIKNILKRMGGWPVLEGDQWDASKFTWKDTVYKFREEGFSINYLIKFLIGLDLKQNNDYLIQLDQAAITLERQYLVKGMEEKRVLALYSYMVDIAVMFGADRGRAAKELRDSLYFEMQLANISSPNVERRDINKLWNPMTIPQLKERFPSIPWAEYISTILPKSIHVQPDEVVNIMEPSYIRQLENLLSTTPKRTQANYMFWRAVFFAVPYLTEELRQRELKFTSVVFGITEREPRWEECVEASAKGLSVAISSMYIPRFFELKEKQSALEMFGNIREEMLKTLKTVEWMDGETRKSALEKIEAMATFAGYPDEILVKKTVEDYYQKFEFTQGKYLEAQLNQKTFELDFSLGLLREPVSKYNWFLRQVIDVNAFYSNQLNYAEVPAGILQGAYFSQDRPNYMNYGAIGYVIGHEIIHGFDDQGRRYDKDGKLVDWWNSETEKTYLRKADCITYQYGNYTVEQVGMKLSGKNTLGENIADNGGIKHAYLAYNSWVEKHGTEKRLPGLQDFTPQQMFWISAANTYCEKYKPEGLKLAVMIDTHPPGEFRVIGPFSNRPEFAKDFKCPTGSKMNPSKKCQVW